MKQATRRNSLLFAVIAVALAIGAVLVSVDRSKTGASEQPLRLRLSSFGINLNPLALADTESRRVASLLHLGLIRVANDGTVLPAVASGWRRSGSTTTFGLKAGATFNDGSPITVAEVKDSLCRSMQPTALFSWSLASIRHSRSADGKSVSCDGIATNDGAGEVMLTEDAPKPWLLEALAGPGGWITKGGVAPGKHGNVPGAGPYTLDAVVPDTSVTLRARKNGALAASSNVVTFTLIGDDTQAATALLTGQLDLLEVTNPTLARLVGIDRADQPKDLVMSSVPSDRMRVIIVNRNGLAAKGLSPLQTRALMKSLNLGFNRRDFTVSQPQLATEASSPFPFLVPPGDGAGPNAEDASSLPAATLTVITESDAYSDLIASRIPKSVGAVRIDYKGIDKGLLVDRIIKGDFDLASVAIEGTLHAPEFWLSFFQPGSPFTVFGAPIEALKDRQLDSEDGRADALRIAATEGNWVGLLREKNVVVSRKGVAGIRFTPSGQASFEALGRQ